MTPDPWHDLPHSERRRIAASLGQAADSHFQAACRSLGIQYRDLNHFPVLITDLCRCQKALRALQERHGSISPARASQPPRIAK